VAGSIAAVTGFLVGGLSEYSFGDSEVVMLAWTVMALPSVIAKGMAGHRTGALEAGGSREPS
jgi:hypothetical protein